MKKTIIIVGAGKGLGNSIAKKFAQNNFRVVLMAKEYEEKFSKKGIEVYTHVGDAAKTVH